ncbi:unnamed protein product [Rhizoctonia solani]|nr:unnamed protein product [Rhizoctonia solani]
MTKHTQLRSHASLKLSRLLYSRKKNGLRIGEQGRLAVTALSLEILYLAWYNGVGIELSERQLENWPLRIWKNSANLDIDLHSLVKQVNLRLV